MNQQQANDFRNEILSGIKGGLDAYKANAIASIEDETRKIMLAAEKFIDRKIGEYFFVPPESKK